MLFIWGHCLLSVWIFSFSSIIKDLWYGYCYLFGYMYISNALISTGWSCPLNIRDTQLLYVVKNFHFIFSSCFVLWNQMYFFMLSLLQLKTHQRIISDWGISLMFVTVWSWIVFLLNISTKASQKNWSKTVNRNWKLIRLTFNIYFHWGFRSNSHTHTL